MQFVVLEHHFALVLAVVVKVAVEVRSRNK
jgi:hypothetical protein